MASLSEIENSSQSQNQDEEVLADKPRMHTHFFVHSQILFAYRIVIGSDRIWGDPIRNPIIPIGSDRIWGDPIRIRSDKTIGLSDRIGFELIRSDPIRCHP